MNVTRNAVYSYVYDEVKAANASVYITSVYEPTFAKLPAVVLREIGDFRNSENMSFSGAQGVRTSTFEAQVISGKTNGSLSEAYTLLDAVRMAFFKLHYNETNAVIVEDGSTGRFRMRASYRRVIGDYDPMPSASTVSTPTPTPSVP